MRTYRPVAGPPTRARSCPGTETGNRHQYKRTGQVQLPQIPDFGSRAAAVPAATDGNRLGQHMPAGNAASGTGARPPTLAAILPRANRRWRARRERTAGGPAGRNAQRTGRPGRTASAWNRARAARQLGTASPSLPRARPDARRVQGRPKAVAPAPEVPAGGDPTPQARRAQAHAPNTGRAEVLNSQT